MISFFKGQYDFLSNFYPSIIVHDTIEYPTVEHFYQAIKTKDLKQRKFIASLPYPGQAKKAGRKLVLRPDWDDIKIKVMAHGLQLKFTDRILKQKLIETYPHALVEGNYWHDNYWGDCMCKECDSFAGRNNLGQLLELLRMYLINVNLPPSSDHAF